MADQNQKPTSGATPTTNGSAEQLSRRDQFTIAFASAILGRSSGRNAGALAREVVTFVDAFLTELDRPKGA